MSLIAGPIEAGVFARSYRKLPVWMRRIADVRGWAKFNVMGRSKADKRYIKANKAAWTIFAILIAGVLWPAAPNWFLLTLCFLVATATVIAWKLVPNVLSKAAIKSEENSGLFILIGFAPLGLALRASYRFELVDWQWPFMAAVILGLPITIQSMRPILALNSWFFVTISVPFLCFAGAGSLIWSALLFANGALLSEQVAIRKIEIAAKYAQREKYGTTYWINAAQPIELNEITHFKVSKITYQKLVRGGSACINVSRGYLLIRWYSVSQCG